MLVHVVGDFEGVYSGILLISRVPEGFIESRGSKSVHLLVSFQKSSMNYNVPKVFI